MFGFGARTQVKELEIRKKKKVLTQSKSSNFQIDRPIKTPEGFILI